MRELGDRMRCKSKCCQSRPRCKRCPVVWRQLAKQGYAEREGRRRYVVIDVVPKHVLKSARG